MKIGKLLGFGDREKPAPAKPKSLDRTGTHPPITQSVPSPFRAVSIVHTGKCCQAIQGLGTKRFLAREAPALPLQSCAMPEACACRFKKHDDRRASDDDRRALGTTTSGIWYAGPERRGEIKRGRRSTDR